MSEIKGGFMKVEKLDVLLPKFSISGNLELVEPLQKLNISQLFGGNSNLTGFLDQYGGEDDTVSLNSALLGLCSTLSSRRTIPSFSSSTTSRPTPFSSSASTSTLHQQKFRY